MSGHRRSRIERLPSLRELATRTGAFLAAFLTGLAIVVLLRAAGALLCWHEALCARCKRDPALYRRLVNTRANAVSWEAFATAHDDDKGSHRAADGIQPS